MSWNKPSRRNDDHCKPRKKKYPHKHDQCHGRKKKQPSRGDSHGKGWKD